MPRREGEATSEYLARELDGVGLHDMAQKARLFHYDDFKCPDYVEDAALNINRLVADLKYQAHMQLSVTQRDKIGVLIVKAMRGEYDSTPEESEAWAQSEEGQAVFQELIEGVTKHNIFDQKDN